MNDPRQDALQVTALLPETAVDSIVMFEAHPELRVAVIERDAAGTPHTPPSGSAKRIDLG